MRSRRHMPLSFVADLCGNDNAVLYLVLATCLILTDPLQSAVEHLARRNMFFLRPLHSARPLRGD